MEAKPSELENRSTEMINGNREDKKIVKEKITKYQELQDYINECHIYIIGVPEDEERASKISELFKLKRKKYQVTCSRNSGTSRRINTKGEMQLYTC